MTGWPNLLKISCHTFAKSQWPEEDTTDWSKSHCGLLGAKLRLRQEAKINQNLITYTTHSNDSSPIYFRFCWSKVVPLETFYVRFFVAFWALLVFRVFQVHAKKGKPLSTKKCNVGCLSSVWTRNTLLKNRIAHCHLQAWKSLANPISCEPISAEGKHGTFNCDSCGVNVRL